MAGQRARQTDQSLIITLQTLVVTHVIADQCHCLLQGLQATLLVAGRQSKEVADEVGNL